MNFAPSEKTPVHTALPTSRSYPIVAVLCCVFLLTLTGAAWSLQQTRGEKILVGVTVAGVPLGGLTRAEASHRLSASLAAYWQGGVRIHTADRQVFNLEPHSAWLKYDVDAAIRQTDKIGRGSLKKRLTVPLISRVYGYEVSLPTRVDETRLAQAVREVLGDQLRSVRDARLEVDINDTGYAVHIEPDAVGIEADITALSQSLQRLDPQSEPQPVPLQLTTIQPTIHSGQLTHLIAPAQNWLERTPFWLTVDDSRFSVTRQDLASWLHIVTSSQPFQLTLATEKLSDNLRRKVGPLIKPARDGRIEVGQNGKAGVFEAPQEGSDIDASTTIANILSGLTAGSSTIPLALQRVTPRILGEGERLGIREVIGIGRSNFAGSPVNRRKNIDLGAKKIHLALVPPKEEFSMIKTLGSIDGVNGWLPELVIKGNKTTPEFGGGLCQVGTTMFRTALAGGLPITERRNHSYRVRYYEPAGTDATIYEPAPDFKFKNDTDNWLLVTTRIYGDNLEFTLWGTRDGRVIEQTKPRIFNIVPAPPKKIVETLELKPGEEKCTEKEHAGADAQFDYTVTYASGTTMKKTFFSRYRPWQAVCLVGVEKLTQPVDASVDQTGVNNPNL